MLLRKLKQYAGGELFRSLNSYIISADRLSVNDDKRGKRELVSRTSPGMLRLKGSETKSPNATNSPSPTSKVHKQLAVSVTLVYRSELVEFNNGTPKLLNSKLAARFREIQALLEISDAWRHDPTNCPCPLFFGIVLADNLHDDVYIKIVTEVLPRGNLSVQLKTPRAPSTISISPRSFGSPRDSNASHDKSNADIASSLNLTQPDDPARETERDIEGALHTPANGCLSPLEAIQLSVDIARSLERIHRTGWAHSNLSPDAIYTRRSSIYDADRCLVLVGFHGARKFRPGPKAPPPSNINVVDVYKGGAVSTPPKSIFMRPAADPEPKPEPAVLAADVYSFGWILWSLWTGRKIPVSVGSGTPVKSSMKEKDRGGRSWYDCVNFFGTGPISFSLRHIVSTMIALEPEKRPTISEVRRLLEALEDCAGGTRPVPVPKLALHRVNPTLPPTRTPSPAKAPVTAPRELTQDTVPNPDNWSVGSTASDSSVRALRTAPRTESLLPKPTGVGAGLLTKSPAVVPTSISASEADNHDNRDAAPVALPALASLRTKVASAKERLVTSLVSLVLALLAPFLLRFTASILASNFQADQLQPTSRSDTANQSTPSPRHRYVITHDESVATEASVVETSEIAVQTDGDDFASPIPATVEDTAQSASRTEEKDAAPIHKMLAAKGTDTAPVEDTLLSPTSTGSSSWRVASPDAHAALSPKAPLQDPIKTTKATASSKMAEPDTIEGEFVVKSAVTTEPLANRLPEPQHVPTFLTSAPSELQLPPSAVHARLTEKFEDSPLGLRLSDQASAHGKAPKAALPQDLKSELPPPPTRALWYESEEDDVPNELPLTSPRSRGIASKLAALKMRAKRPTRNSGASVASDATEATIDAFLEGMDLDKLYLSSPTVAQLALAHAMSFAEEAQGRTSMASELSFCVKSAAGQIGTPNALLEPESAGRHLEDVEECVSSRPTTPDLSHNEENAKELLEAITARLTGTAIALVGNSFKFKSHGQPTGDSTPETVVSRLRKMSGPDGSPLSVELPSDEDEEEELSAPVTSDSGVTLSTGTEGSGLGSGTLAKDGLEATHPSRWSPLSGCSPVQRSMSVNEEETQSAWLNWVRHNSPSQSSLDIGPGFPTGTSPTPPPSEPDRRYSTSRLSNASSVAGYHPRSPAAVAQAAGGIPSHLRIPGMPSGAMSPGRTTASPSTPRNKSCPLCGFEFGAKSNVNHLISHYTKEHLGPGNYFEATQPLIEHAYSHAKVTWKHPLSPYNYTLFFEE